MSAAARESRSRSASLRPAKTTIPAISSAVTMVGQRYLVRPCRRACGKSDVVSREATVDESQILAALGSVPLFAGLGKRDLRRIAGASTIAHVPAGHHVVREGFSAEAFYIILDGQASVTGPAATTHLRPGDFCGELGLLDGSPRSASVLAQSDIVAVR